MSTAVLVLEIPPELVAAGRKHAEDCFPEECCGVLLGTFEASKPRVVRLVAAANVAAARNRRYEIGPETLARALRQASREGLSLLGFYHSHPQGSSRPSASDLQEAWPATSYLIFSVEGGRVTAERSWRLRTGDARFTEESLSIPAGPVQDGRTLEEKHE